MKLAITALLFLLINPPVFAQEVEEKAKLEAISEREFPIILEIEKSQITNIAAGNPQMLAKSIAWGEAPPIFGVFGGTLNRFNMPPDHERHWKFGCWAENTRYGQNPCVDMPIGLHRARWVHNRELLEVFAYDSDGNPTLRYLDVTIDPKNPPPTDDPIQNLPTFHGLFETIQTKQPHPLLVHVYGSVSLSFPAGEIPARTNCNISAPVFAQNQINVNCTQYPPIPISQGEVQVEATIDGQMPHVNLTCDAKWRWSGCAVIEPGFYEARWEDDGHSRIVLAGQRDGKPKETGFEVH
jgi:hypothetical protein